MAAAGSAQTGAQLAAARKAQEQQAVGDVKTQQEILGERGKTAAKTIDEKLTLLNSIQTEVHRGIDNIDNNKVLFGGGTNALLRANDRLNPLKTQSDEYRNTADILKLTQQENLTNLASLLKGSFSDKDMVFINQNKINENSSPAQVKRWLESYERAATRAYEQQATSVNTGTGSSPATGTTRERTYNPATGKLE
jgi:hypothetical protein